MEILMRQPAECLVADPCLIGRFGSADSAIAQILKAPKTEEDFQKLERIMLADEQMSCPVIHRFAPGIYIREITMPAGALVIGAKHKCEHLNIMLKGRVTVCNDNGQIVDLVAPMIFTGKPGRKFGYVREEVVWQNVYATSETDIETLERMFTEKSPVAIADKSARLTIGASVGMDRADYQHVLAEVGYTDEMARAEAATVSDMIPFPSGGYKVMVSDSVIEGRGLFATASISSGEWIAPARISGKRTPAGRYTNHAKAPNATFELLPNGDLWLVATRDIPGMKGGRLGDEITIDYRVPLAHRSAQCHLQ